MPPGRARGIVLFFVGQLLGIRQRRVKFETSLVTRVERMVFTLFVLIGLHVAAMLIFEHEQLTRGGQDAGAEIYVNALWVTMTTVLTVGYGDIYSATIPGKFATMLLLYTGAVFIVANVASAAVELRMNRINRMRDGTWRWKLRDHILIINSPAVNAERYLVQLVNLLRADRQYQHTPIAVLAEQFSEGLPSAVRDLGVVYVKGSPHEVAALKQANAEKAHVIVLLAENDTDPRSDSLNFDILLELHETYTGAKIVSEVVEDSSRARFRRFGSHRIIRPSRSYPEFVVRAITSPGSEAVVEDVLNGTSSQTLRYNVRIDRRKWAELAAAVLHAGVGTPLGYVDEDRNVVSNPDPNSVVIGRGLFVMVRNEHSVTRAQIQTIINTVAVQEAAAVGAVASS